MRLGWLLVMTLALGALSFGPCGGSGGPAKPTATSTPSVPQPEDVMGQWVQQNRNVAFVGDCANARPGIDVGKLCMSIAGERGTRRAYNLGPTFSDPTALAILENDPDGWKVLSVTNHDPTQDSAPGINWPLEVGDQVIIIGVGEGDCLSIREQPTQQGKKLACEPDGSKAIVQEGPVQAETLTWWRIAGQDPAGNAFSGWAAGRWLRLPEAIAQALQPPTPAPPPGQ